MLNIKREKGITLIALIITIIVMLILVAVTINTALSAGIFTKAKLATESTEVRTIQEALVIEKAGIIAGLYGENPEDFGISLNSLNISQSIKDKYSPKLTISKDGVLYYKKGISAKDSQFFQSLGIEEEPGEEVNIWIQRGVTNALIGETYTDENNVYELELKPDGGLHAVMDREYNLTSEEVDEIFEPKELNDFTLDVNGTSLRLTVSNNSDINVYLAITPTVLKTNWDEPIEYNKVYQGRVKINTLGMDEAPDNYEFVFNMFVLKETNRIVEWMYLFDGTNIDTSFFGVSVGAAYNTIEKNGDYVLIEGVKFTWDSKKETFIVRLESSEMENCDMQVTNQSLSTVNTLYNINKAQFFDVYSYGIYYNSTEKEYITIMLDDEFENNEYAANMSYELNGVGSWRSSSSYTSLESFKNTVENFFGDVGIEFVSGHPDQIIRNGKKYNLVTDLTQ